MGVETKIELLLLEFIDNFSMTQRVKENTRMDNILDLVFANSESVRSCKVEKNITTSDHDTILVKFITCKTSQTEKEEMNCYTTDIQKYELEKLDEEGWR